MEPWAGPRGAGGAPWCRHITGYPHWPCPTPESPPKPPPLQAAFPGEELVVFEGGLPPAEAISLFQRARVVLGPHGAGLSHALFSAPGTALVEFLFLVRAGWWSQQRGSCTLLATTKTEGGSAPVCFGTWPSSALPGSRAQACRCCVAAAGTADVTAEREQGPGAPSTPCLSHKKF